jgi:uncharacterized membrane protein YcaP (DUF421 family)
LNNEEDIKEFQTLDFVQIVAIAKHRQDIVLRRTAVKNFVIASSLWLQTFRLFSRIALAQLCISYALIEQD